MKGHSEDLWQTIEQFKQLTALVSEVQIEYSLVRMRLDKANTEELFAKVRMSIVTQIVTECRCTKARRNSHATRSFSCARGMRGIAPGRRCTARIKPSLSYAPFNVAQFARECACYAEDFSGLLWDRERMLRDRVAALEARANASRSAALPTPNGIFGFSRVTEMMV